MPWCPSLGMYLPAMMSRKNEKYRTRTLHLRKFLPCMLWPYHGLCRGRKENCYLSLSEPRIDLLGAALRAAFQRKGKTAGSSGRKQFILPVSTRAVVCFPTLLCGSWTLFIIINNHFSRQNNITCWLTTSFTKGTCWSGLQWRSTSHRPVHLKFYAEISGENSRKWGVKLVATCDGIWPSRGRSARRSPSEKRDVCVIPLGTWIWQFCDLYTSRNRLIEDHHGFPG